MANYQTIAPLEGITGKRKTFTKFDCYVRAKIGTNSAPPRKRLLLYAGHMLLRKDTRMCLNEAHPRVFEENLLTSIDSESVNSGCSVYLTRT